jgi:opacity protein-like surface antigen
VNRVLQCWLVMCVLTAPLEAQGRPPSRPVDEPLRILGVAFLASQQFAAKTTLDAAFGEHSGRFFGGGVQITQRGVFIEATLSRFERSGQRAFIDNGQVFPLDVPLTATIVPFEIGVGYLFRRRTPIVPYAGGGFGVYHYSETSPFGEPEDEISLTHVGYLALGGVEFRVHRWIGLSGDVEYTYVGGILGEAGLSKGAGESNLGGVAVRARVVVGLRP